MPGHDEGSPYSPPFPSRRPGAGARSLIVTRAAG
jgi:hypothetical protein